MDTNQEKQVLITKWLQGIDAHIGKQQTAMTRLWFVVILLYLEVLALCVLVGLK